MQGTPASSIFPMGDKDAFGRGRRYPTSDKAAVCSGRCSSKSPSTDAKVNYLVIRYLRFRSVRGGLDLCSPSTALKVNCLVIRHLYFRSVRGDLQEGHGCSSRCQALSFRAQNRFFCALRDKHDSGRRSERQRHCRTREWHIIRLVFILSRIGKEGKIAFAGVIGEGLF